MSWNFGELKSTLGHPCFRETFLQRKDMMTKVHRSKGRTLLMVCILPSKNKLNRLGNEKHLFAFTYCFFYLKLSCNKQIILFQKQNSALPYSNLRTMESVETNWDLLHSTKITNTEFFAPEVILNSLLFQSLHYIVTFFKDIGPNPVSLTSFWEFIMVKTLKKIMSLL